MELLRAHRILISAAIGLAVLLLIYGVSRYLSTRDTQALATGIGGAGVGIALSLYLRWFLRKQASRPRPGSGRP
jgi:hypothetical protein